MPRVEIGPFSLCLASDWTLSTVILAGPIEDTPAEPSLLTPKASRPFQQNIVMTIEQVGPEVSLESYVEKQLEGLRVANVTRSEAAAPARVELDGGLEGLLTEQIIVGGDGTWVQQMQLVSIKDGCAYTIIASHLAGESFERVRNDFRSILLSFE